MQLVKNARKDYTFWRQFNEKPSIIPGCPGMQLVQQTAVVSVDLVRMHKTGCSAVATMELVQQAAVVLVGAIGMHKTGCSGETRVVLRVPSSS